MIIFASVSSSWVKQHTIHDVETGGHYACVVAGDKWKISVSNFLLILLNLPCSAVRIKGRERKKDIKSDRQTSGGKKG